MKLSVVVLLGLAPIAGCAKHRIPVQVQAIGKSYLNPNKGDKLTWVDRQNRPLTVSFIGEPPLCVEVGHAGQPDETSVCTVAVDSGVYQYTCRTCIDPGIAVGSTKALINGLPEHFNQRNSAQPPDPYITCAGDKAKTPDIKASVGDTIEWFGLGKANKWTVAVAPGMCESPNAIDQDFPFCTIKAGAVSSSFQVVAPSCTAEPKASGTLTIR